jgi:hypothetical protein
MIVKIYKILHKYFLLRHLKLYDNYFSDKIKKILTETIKKKNTYD